ncbi:hypothetical protein HDV03_000839 [Kappamyces sp. JEL0829]|nr:hypothetical protein HDV03_000839 [Kappamyces sp. JEL0829]
MLAAKRFHPNEMTRQLVHEAEHYAQQFMKQFDSSHDFAHVNRVRKMALRLAVEELALFPSIDLVLVEVAALLHDVNDHKYHPQTDATKDVIFDLVLGWGADEQMARQVSLVVKHCSYSYETKHGHTSAYQEAMLLPEARIVQDADRLDAIGAIGIARCFTFGATRGRSLEDGIEHFKEKLVHLASMMKTQTGRGLAQERTRRIKTFMDWYGHEQTSLE